MKSMKKICVLFVLILALGALALPVFAEAAQPAGVTASDETVITETESESSGISGKALAAAIAIGLAAAGGAVGMGIASGKAVDGISRQPQAESKIRTTLMLGLVFIETAIIYALLVVILIIFVL